MLIGVILGCQPPDSTETDPNVTVWDTDQDVATDVVVAEGATLVIEPGVTATFAAGAGLLVEGTLVARGTPEAPITLTGDTWLGVRFEDTSTDASFVDVDDFVEGSIVEHAVIERAARGMTITASAPYVHAVTFRDNVIAPTIDTIGGAGLLVRGGATPRVRASRFERNVANTFAFGGGVFVHRSDPILQDLVFDGNVAAYGAGLTTDLMAAPIVGATFTGNDSESEGGGASLISSVSAVLDTSFVGNHAAKDGAGLHVCVTCDPHAAPYLFDLVITDNTSDNDDPEHGAAGLGAAFLGALGDSVIAGNLRDGAPSELGWFHPIAEGWPAWVAAPDLAGNYWGTTDLEAIAAAVYDGADDARHGVVTLAPVLDAAPAAPKPRAVVSTRRQHYEQPGEPIPVYLTLYNPGPERAVTLALTKDGTPIDALAYPGATRDGDAWSLVMPEDSVWFGTIAESTYDGATVDVTYEAALADEGGPIGVPVSARYVGP